MWGTSCFVRYFWNLLSKDLTKCEINLTFLLTTSQNVRIAADQATYMYYQIENMSEMYSLIRNGHFMASFFTFFTHINSSSLEPSQLEALWEPNCIFCWSRMVGQCHQPQSSLFQTIVIRIRQRPLLENPAKCLLLLVLVATLSWFRFQKSTEIF